MGILDKWRYRQAFTCGKWEHIFSRVLGVVLLAGVVIIVMDRYSNYEIMDMQVMQILWTVSFVCYCLYYLFHRLEKAFFPK